MCIKPIISHIVPANSRLNNIFRGRKTAQIKQSADNFILNNPELIQKRQAVVKYLNRTDFTPSEVITDRIGDYLLDNLYDNKVGELLELCGDDLKKNRPTARLIRTCDIRRSNPRNHNKKQGSKN